MGQWDGLYQRQKKCHSRSAPKEPTPFPEQLHKYVGRCIYCGAEPTAADPLSDEHVIPFALGGKHQLDRASCREHAKITSQIEGKVLRGDLGDFRAALNFPTRHKDRRQTTYKLELLVDGEWREETVPAEDYTPVITLPKFKVPAYVDKREYAGGIEMIGIFTNPAIRDNDRVVKKYRAQGVGIRAIRFPEEWARMFGKIAIASAVWKVGLDAIQRPWLLDAVLGKTDDIGMWVGCEENAKPMEKGHGHTVAIGESEGVLFAKLKFFDWMDITDYLVIIGEAVRAGAASTV